MFPNGCYPNYASMLRGLARFSHQHTLCGDDGMAVGSKMTISRSVAVFGESGKVPEEVGGLFLDYVEVSEEHDRVTICRYRADTADGQWIGANTFLYDRDLELEDGAESTLVIAERDQSLRVLNGGALEPKVLGKRQLKLPAGGGRSLTWQWASLRDGPLSDALVTHVAIRVDRGYYNKVLFSYPVGIDEVGRKALVVFLTDWHHCVLAA